MGIQVNVTPFIKDMAQAYAWANMVLCRAGALTVAELCAVGLGAILVPFPFAVDDHQSANADFMVQNNAALCIQQAELTEKRLVDTLSEFSRSPEKRLAMAQAAYQLRKVNVAEKFYEILREIITQEACR
jgi:UDP-N-acetylglucosamine--N-acetylmuramyl-(pentapeptide) pyrophosphoryl-undecaprenol N-acetylglucosamine transferase